MPGNSNEDTKVIFDKDKFEASLKLSQMGFDLWNQRRAVEWRMTFGLWALLAGAIADQAFRLPLCILLWCSTAIMAAYVGLWLWPLWKANARDAGLGWHYYDKAQKIFDKDQSDAPTDGRSFFTDWASLFQIIATAFLLAAACYLKVK